MDNTFVLIGHAALRDIDGSIFPPVPLYVKRDDYEKLAYNPANLEKFKSCITSDVMTKEK